MVSFLVVVHYEAVKDNTAGNGRLHGAGVVAVGAVALQEAAVAAYALAAAVASERLKPRAYKN